MNNLKVWLGVALAAQVVLAGGLLLADRRGADFSQQEPLLAVALDEISTLVITGDDGEVRLEKSGEQWVLPQLESLPANEAKLSETLSKLTAIKGGWPVATSGPARERFEVSDDKFQRKVEVFGESGSLATLYLGTSPAYRSVHTRLQGSDDVFRVKLATHDFPLASNDWLNRSLLRVDTVSAIRGDDFDFTLEGDNWVLAQPAVVDAEVPEIDTDKVDELKSFFTGLSVQGLAQEPLDIEPAVELAIGEGDTAWTYQFFEHDERHYVKRNDRELLFEMSSFDYDKVADIDLASFAMEDPEENTAEGKEPADISAADSPF